MRHYIYKQFFTLTIFAVYVCCLGIIGMVLNFFVKAPDPVILGSFVAIFILSHIQGATSADIFFAIHEKYWQAVYLSFHEFWGQLFMRLFPARKELPEQLQIRDRNA